MEDTSVSDGSVNDMKKGQKMSDEQKKKISETMKGYEYKKEWKNLQSEKMKGHIVSDETKKKISEALKINNIKIMAYDYEDEEYDFYGMYDTDMESVTTDDMERTE